MSDFLMSLLIDLRKVFLGLSSSVLILAYEKDTSVSIFLRTVLLQALLSTISLKSFMTSFYLTSKYSMNFLKSGLLFLDSKLYI
jgi:hypothetical protein